MSKIKKIKDWCKKGYGCPAVKLEKVIDDGFIVSRIKKVRAGMHRNLYTNSFISIPIKTVRKERIYIKYFYNDSNGDIYGGETIRDYKRSK